MVSHDIHVSFSGPEDYEAISEALAHMWNLRIGRFSMVPKPGGFAVMANGQEVFRSGRCGFDAVTLYYKGAIGQYAGKEEFPGRVYRWAFREELPTRFIEVTIATGAERIDFQYYIPMGTPAVATQR